MIKYFIIFTAIGFAIGRFIPSPKVGLFYIAFIALFWGGHDEVIWGLAAFGELSLGYLLATVFVKPRTQSTTAWTPSNRQEPTPLRGSRMTNSATQPTVDFDLTEAYSKIAREMEANQVDKGLWLQALVSSGGVAGPKQEAAYAGLRLEAMRAAQKHDANLRLRQAERKRVEEEVRTYGSELVSLREQFKAGHSLTATNLEKLVNWAIETSNVEIRSPVTGETLLHPSSAAGLVHLVQRLVSKGVDKSIRNEAGLTARELAERSNQHVALMYL